MTVERRAIRSGVQRGAGTRPARAVGVHRRLSIGKKLFFSILLIPLVSFAILTFSTIRSFEALVAAEADQELEEHLNYARNQFFVRAEQIRFTLMGPASSTNVQERLRARDRAWFKTALERWQQILPFAETLTVIDAGKGVVARAKSDLAGDHFELGGVVEQSFRTRKAVLSTELIPLAQLAREGVKDYARGGRLYESRLEEAMIVIVVVPVLDSDGRLLGALVAGDVINRDPFLPFQMKKVFGTDTEMSITERGQRIASSFMETTRTPATLPGEVLVRLEEGEQYRSKTRLNGKEYLTAIEPIVNLGNKFIGALEVYVSTEDHHRMLRVNERNIIESALIGIILSVSIALYAARRLTDPLKALSRGVEQIERGDLDHRVAVTTHDEFGHLADSFNRMVGALAERDRTITKKTHDLQELNALLKELNDVLERKVAERTAALRMEMGTLEAILTSMADGVVVTDSENRVTLFNPAAQKIFDLVPHRVLQQPIELVCELGGFPSLPSLIREIRERGAAASTREEEVTLRGKNLKVNLSPLLDENGVLAGVVTAMRDVTREEEVDRMKTEFISTVSHELKTPLTSIKGSLQFIMTKAKWLTGTERELISVCLRNTDRLIRLINDILDISKIESGRVEMNFKPLVVAELVVYAIEEIKGFALSRNITIVNSVGDYLPPVYGDHDRLIQVLTNLIANAVKFSPEGKVVMVSAEREESYVAVSVADHGKEIQWGDRDKLFRKFQQLQNATGGRGGTGLGLAICKEIISQHHGRIYFHPGATGGNVFTFTVPIHEETT
jgi:PAS domain S-box-containing protein